MANYGQGSVSVAQRALPPGSGGLTGAREGLIDNGGFAELGSSSAIDPLPGLSIDRNIPMNGNRIVLNTNTAFPSDNQLVFSDQGITLIKNNVGGVTPFIVLGEALNNFQTLIDDRSISINGDGADPFIGQTRSGDITNSTLSNRQLVITTDDLASPALVVVGIANGTIYGSQFLNSDLSAGSSIASRWFMDSVNDDFQILKFCDADGGGVLLRNKNTASPLATFAIQNVETTSVIQHLIGARLVTNTSLDSYTFGDVNNVGNGMKLEILNTPKVIGLKQAGAYYVYVDANARVVSMGDVSGAGNNTRASADDISKIIRFNADVEIIGQDTMNNRFLQLAISSNQYKVGDIDAKNNNVVLLIDDANKKANITILGNQQLLVDPGNQVYSLGDVDVANNGTLIGIDDRLAFQQVTIAAVNGLKITGDPVMLHSGTPYTNGAAAALGTLTNAPAAGNPTKWIPVDDNGTTRYIPAW